MSIVNSAGSNLQFICYWCLAFKYFMFVFKDSIWEFLMICIFIEIFYNSSHNFLFSRYNFLHLSSFIIIALMCFSIQFHILAYTRMAFIDFIFLFMNHIYLFFWMSHFVVAVEGWITKYTLWNYLKSDIPSSVLMVGCYCCRCFYCLFSDFHDSILKCL